jgi:hypothetical protein
MNSASLYSLAGRYENPIPPRCLCPIDFLKIPAQYVNTPTHIPPPETAKLKKAADVSENTGIRGEYKDSRQWNMKKTAINHIIALKSY